MTAKDIFDFLNEIAPLKDAMPYDNPGFLLGDKEREVTKAVVCLDCTKKAVQKAKELGANLIITHHPVIYDPLKNITADSNSRIYDCLTLGVSVISMHTNLDVAEKGVNDCLATALGLKNIKKIVDPEGFAFRKGQLTDPMTPEGFARYIKSRLGGVVRYVKGGTVIKNVAVCGGSGSGFVDLCIEEKVDALVTADIKHSVLIDANEKGFSLFDAGHFHTENVVVEPLSKQLSEHFPEVEFVPLNLREIHTV